MRWIVLVCNRLFGSNCTFMELKFEKNFVYGVDTLVQIVPLWNWNLSGVQHLPHSQPFKLYLYGIEISKRLKRWRYGEVQIVPLWNWNLDSAAYTRLREVQIVPLWNWNLQSVNVFRYFFRSNCTFMELKLRCCNLVIISVMFKLYLYGIEIGVRNNSLSWYSVQIVPLWNWNQHNPFQTGFAFCCSNCTFMELKLAILWQVVRHHKSSNCTFMELKWIFCCIPIESNSVQIVPLWNWN